MKATCIRESYHVYPLKPGDVVEYEMTNDGDIRVPDISTRFSYATFHAFFRPEGIENMTNREFNDKLWKAYRADTALDERGKFTVQSIVDRTISYDDKNIICSIEHRTGNIRVSFNYGPWELFTNYGEAFMAICGHKWREV